MGKKFSRLPCLLILKPCSAVEVQFTVAPPQHFLYFFREPDGYWSFRPTFQIVRAPTIKELLKDSSRQWLQPA